MSDKPTFPPPVPEGVTCKLIHCDQRGLKAEDLTDDEYRRVSTLLTILRNNTGCMSPVEEFIEDLIDLHGSHPVTPSRIQRHLDRCVEDFDRAIEIAKFTARQYPELVRESGNPATATA